VTHNRAEIRARQLLQSWGKARAREMAERYIAEATRSGSPAAIALSCAVRDELAALIAGGSRPAG